VLVESGAILDAIDDWVGPGRALLPATGAMRRDALQLISLAIGAGEKAREQLHGALGLLEASCQRRGQGTWLVDERLTQADITVACICTLLNDSLDLFADASRYPALQSHVDRCERLSEFQATRSRWFAAGIKS
jgi:glutathione S-transferase